MKLFTKLTKASTALAVLGGVMFCTTSVHALAPGQIAGGNANFTISNVTKGTGFANTQSADACDVLEYRVLLYNPGPSPLSDVKVEASINTMTKYTHAVPTITVYTADGATKSVAYQANINFSTPQTQSYEQNSTKLLNSDGAVIKSSASGTLSDKITLGAGGISLGAIGDSVTEYLQFRTKVGCPTTTPQPAYSCDAFNIVADVNRKVKVTAFNTTATNGAVFKNAVVDWGDNSTDLTAANIIGQTHEYAKDGTYTVTATAHFTVAGADVTAGGPNCVKQITVKTDTASPIYTCDLFNIVAESDRTVKVSGFETTAKNGAVYKNAVIDWGDSSDKVTATNPVGQTHQYAKDGTYTITATAHFTVNGQDVTATGVECGKKVTFQGNQPPVVTPPTPTPPASVAPTTLVNTGPGQVAGLFAVVTAAGALAHRRFMSRFVG